MEKLHIDKMYEYAANKIVQDFKYGDFISKEKLLELFDIESPKYGTRKDFEKFAFQYMGLVENLREVLLVEHKMYLANSKGKGYIIVMPQDQTDVSIDKLKSVIKKELKNAAKALINVNTEMLTNEQIRQRDDASAKVGSMRAFTRKLIN